MFPVFTSSDVRSRKIVGTAEPVVVIIVTPVLIEVAIENPSVRTVVPVASGDRN
jgi:hypothetical protein